MGARIIPAVVLTMVFSFSTQAQDKETNHCHDPQSWTDWNERLKEHAGET